MFGNNIFNWFSRLYDGDLTAFGGPALCARRAGRLRASQIELIHRYTPWMMGACIVNALVVAVTMAGTVLFEAASIWAFTVAAAACFMYVRWARHRGMPTPRSVSVRAIHRTIHNAAVYGLLWGLVPLFFFSGEGRTTDLVLVCVCSGMMCGAAFALSTVPAAAIVACLGLAVGIAFSLLLAGDFLHLLVGCLLVSYTGVLIRSSISQANTFAARMTGQFQSEEQAEVISMLLCDFAENASDWLWEIDADHRLTYASPRLAEVLACSSADLVNRDFDEIFAETSTIPKEPAGKGGSELLSRLSQNVAFREVVVPVMIKGERRLWSLTGKPIIGPGGQPEGFRGVGTDVTDAREAEDRIRHLARHDALTNLPNRLLFGEELQKAITRLQLAQEPFALLCLDLDHMKAVNDTMGHAGGDAMLIEVARRVTEQLRPVDVCGRIGGDEFAILVAGAATPESISPLAARLVQTLAVPFFFNAGTLTLGASIGIAMAPSDGSDAETLLKNADMALYRTKQTGRGAFHFFEQEMDDRARTRRQLEADLRNALKNDEFQLYYQPLIDVTSGLFTCSEALLRWHHPRRGLVMPMEFIGLAEEMGLIVAIGEWVIKRACIDAAAWPLDIRVAVNLSALQFRSPGLVSVIDRALLHSGLAAKRLEVEVTESVLISESGTARAILDTLRIMGVRIALDDFGTGYSSLSYLRQMPFDKIKIDRSFIHDLVTHPDSAAIVHALIGLASGLNMSITAEGVETSEQLAHLRLEGCGEAQGYLIGHPSPNATLVALLHAQNAATVSRIDAAA